MVVPSDDVYKERVAAQTAAGNKDIPDEAIMEMKGIATPFKYFYLNNMPLTVGYQ